MALWKYFIDNELLQRRDLNRAASALEQVQADLAALHKHTDRLTATCKVMCDMLVARGDLDEDGDTSRFTIECSAACECGEILIERELE